MNTEHFKTKVNLLEDCDYIIDGDETNGIYGYDTIKDGPEFHKFYSDELFQEFIKLCDEMFTDIRDIPEDGFMKYYGNFLSNVLEIKDCFTYCIKCKTGESRNGHKFFNSEHACRCIYWLNQTFEIFYKSCGFLDVLKEYENIN